MEDYGYRGIELCWEDDEENIILYERKFKAALYIRAHFKELMKSEEYKRAYYIIIDELARDCSYNMCDKMICAVSDEERKIQSSILDFEISDRGRTEIEKYKADTQYVLNWVAKAYTEFKI